MSTSQTVVLNAFTVCYRKKTFPITPNMYPSYGLEPVHPAGDIPEIRNVREGRAPNMPARPTFALTDVTEREETLSLKMTTAGGRADPAPPGLGSLRPMTVVF
jgi:hypothetical protein